MTTPGVPGFVGPTARSALVALYRSIAASFAATGNTAKVYFGIKARDNWDTSRVVIIDGEFDGTIQPKALPAGQLFAPTQKNSYNPRELVSWVRPATLSIRGVDPSNPDAEDVQTEASEALIEATLQAVQNAVYTPTPAAGAPAVAVGQANVDWGKCTWLQPPTQQPYGKEFLLALTLRCVFFDVAQATRIPVVGTVTKNLLDTRNSGRAASVAASGGGYATVTGLAFRSFADVGGTLTLSAFDSGGNNGAFPIVQVLSSSSLQIENAGAVAPDAANGAGVWSVAPAPPPGP